MEKVIRQYFCDVCREDITGQGYYSSVTLYLNKSVGVSSKSKAWGELCISCFTKIEEQVQSIIDEFPLGR